MKCRAYLIADSIDTKALPSDIKLKETCFFQIEQNRFVVFPYGVVVCWGDGHLAPIQILLQAHMEKPIPHDRVLFDEFDVELQANPENKLFFEDTIYLPDS